MLVGRRFAMYIQGNMKRMAGNRLAVFVRQGRARTAVPYFVTMMTRLVVFAGGRCLQSKPIGLPRPGRLPTFPRRSVMLLGDRSEARVWAYVRSPCRHEKCMRKQGGTRSQGEIFN